MKVCNVCGVSKSLTDFHKDKDKRLGVRAECKSCRSKKLSGNGPQAEAHRRRSNEWNRRNPQRILLIRAWQARNPEKVRINAFKSKYGATEEQVQTLMNNQLGCCGICGRSLVSPSSTKEYAVDHDHETGRIRGLLCHGCNTNLERYLHLATDFANKCRKYLDTHN